MCLLPEGAIVVCVMVEPTEKGRRKKMSKTTSQTIRGHNLRMRTVTVALVAVLLLLLTRSSWSGQPQQPATEKATPRSTR